MILIIGGYKMTSDFSRFGKQKKESVLEKIIKAVKKPFIITTAVLPLVYAVHTADAKGADTFSKKPIATKEEKKETPKPAVIKREKDEKSEIKTPETEPKEPKIQPIETNTRFHAFGGVSYNSKSPVSDDYERRLFGGLELDFEFNKDWNLTIDALYKSAYSEFTKSDYTSWAFSVAAGTNDNPEAQNTTSLEKLARVLAKGLMGELNFTLGFDNIYSEPVRADVLDDVFVQLGAKFGYSNEDIAVLGYVNIPIPIDFNSDYFKEGNHAKYEFGGEIIGQIAKELAIHYKGDAQIEEYERLLDQTNASQKLGVIFQKLIEDKENYMDLGVYLTADTLNVETPYNHNSTNFGIKAEATIRIGDFLILPTIGWDEGKGASCGALFAYAPLPKKK